MDLAEYVRIELLGIESRNSCLRDSLVVDGNVDTTVAHQTSREAPRHTLSPNQDEGRTFGESDCSPPLLRGVGLDGVPSTGPLVIGVVPPP